MAARGAKKKIKEQIARQAITPSPPSFITEAIQEAKKARIEPKDTDDNILADGAESEFWKLVKDYIEGSLRKLKEDTTKAAMQTGFNLEVLGFRYVLMDQIENFGNDIIKFVEGRKKVVEMMKRTEAEKKKVKAERLKRRQKRR